MPTARGFWIASSTRLICQVLDNAMAHAPIRNRNASRLRSILLTKSGPKSTTTKIGINPISTDTSSILRSPRMRCVFCFRFQLKSKLVIFPIKAFGCSTKIYLLTINHNIYLTESFMKWLNCFARRLSLKYIMKDR